MQKEVINLELIRELEGDLNSLHMYNISLLTRELYLMEDITDQVASVFIKNLKLMERCDKRRITIRQYSSGGDVTAGMAIYDAVLECPCEIDFVTYGTAYSMGSIIPQAVREKGNGQVYTSRNCEWMIHESIVSIENLSRAVKSASAQLIKSTDKMYDIYSKSCKKGKYFISNDYTEEQIKDFIKCQISENIDWYLSADDAVKYGFADDILEEG